MDIEAHRANPEISLERHVKSRVVELGRLLETRAAIYLDTKFWIVLRDCAAGRNDDPAARDLLQRLRKLVQDGRAFCPISESTFLEFLKKGDATARLEIAQAVDELGLGVALLDHRTRLGTEIAHFVHSAGGSDDLHPLHRLIWSKVAYVLGFTHPSHTGFDAETELAIQKAFFDHMLCFGSKHCPHRCEVHQTFRMPIGPRTARRFTGARQPSGKGGAIRPICTPQLPSSLPAL